MTHQFKPTLEDQSVSNLTLSEAIARRAQALAKVEQATAALERAREIAAECQEEADRLAGEEARWIERHSGKLSAWIEGGGRGARPVAAADAKAVQAQMSARANAAAAAEALSRFEAGERDARAALTAADASAREAALAKVRDEIREKFETEFRPLAKQFAAAYEWCCAAYLSAEGRAALTPEEWLELITSGVPSLELLGIGPPWADVRIDRLEQTGAVDRPREARARINRLVGSFAARLAELACGESITSREASEERAA
jgi:hypothetical protein